MKIVLDCGVKASVAGFHVSMTYEGLIEGTIDQRINDMVVEDAKTTQVLGEGRPTYLIFRSSTPVEIFRSCHVLFSVHICVDWSSESHLVVVWFSDDFDDLPISRIIGDAVTSLPVGRIGRRLDS